MKDRYALEARKLSEKVHVQDNHIDMLTAQIDDLKRSVRKANEIIEAKNADILKLEGFVRFASEYYPGCIAQYHAIKKLEDTR